MRWPWSRPQHKPHADRLRLVKIAYARNLAEAELIEGLLRQSGIPSITQRNGGFDVPDFLAAGPRDVLVPEHDAPRARELLGSEQS